VPTNDEVMRVLSLVQQQLAVQAERERQLRESIADLSRDVQALSADVAEMKSMANRWKGGFLVLTALGGIIGWILSTVGWIGDLIGR
jgi:ribosomal protein S2